MKYIAYCRKSTDEKDRQVLSIEAQVAEVKEFAQRENLEIVDFITEAKTAKCPGREKFAEVLERIEKGEAGGILSWHPDRLSRNSIDGGKVIYLLDTGKLLDLKFPSFWFENTPQGKFMLSIAFGQSKYYVDNLSENVKRGIRQKLRRGIWPKQAPFGYVNNPKTKALDINPEQAKVVKRAFEMFAEGNRSFVQIDDFLFDNGIMAKSGRRFHLSGVKHLLTNTFYVGIFRYSGELYQCSHKTFISKALFQKVQERIKKIERPRRHGHNFAFIGLARCGQCGGAITAESHQRYYPQTGRHV